MKKVILSIAVILTATAAGFSQTVIKQGLDSIVTTEWIKEIFSYDSTGNIVLRVYYRWNKEIKDWEEGSKYENMYGANRKQTTFGYRWNNATNEWEKNSKHEYAYDDNGIQIIHIIYEWDNAINDWTKPTSFKYEYAYNDEEQLIEKIEFVKKATNTWGKSYKCEYTYDTNNLIIENFYEWGFYDWINTSQTQFKYDTNGNKIYVFYSVSMESDNKYEYTYDYNGNHTMVVRYSCNKLDNPNVWEKYKKEEYIYDLSYSKTDLIKPCYVDIISANMLTKRISYRWSGTEWEQDDTTTYYWSPKEISK